MTTDLIPAPPAEGDIARAGLRLGVVGIGVSLLTYALAMIEPRLPPLAIALVIGVAIACLIPALPMLRGGRWGSTDDTADTAELMLKLPLRLLADDCRHMARVLATFRDHRRQVRPRRGILRRDVETRMHSWERATMERYEREFRAQSIELADAVIEAGQMSASARQAFAHPSAAQIEHLPERFEEAARLLDRAAR